MKNIVALLLPFLFLFSCGKKETLLMPREIQTLVIETLLEDSLLNVRALEIDKNGLASFATSSGRIGGTSKNKTNDEARLTHQLTEQF